MSALLLVLPWLFGVQLAHRVLKQRDWLEALSLGWGCGWLFTIMAINFMLLAGLQVERSILLALALCGVATALLAPVKAEPLKKPKLHWASWTFLALGAVLVHSSVVCILYLNPDDDFFLHAPMQAQILHGNFPVMNPFFSEISYGGHYARDLLMVTAAWASGAPLYACQIPVTLGLQLAAFFILFAALRRHNGSELQAVLGTLFVFMGVNAGFRGGWLDTVANNNALTQMVFALCFYLLIQVLFERRTWPEAVVTGAAMGGFAWCYETNFATTSVALCLLAATTALLRQLTKRQLLVALVIVGVTGPLSVTQGGLLTDLFQKVTGRETVIADEVEQSQNLEVSVKVPKDELFKIKLVRGGEDLSMAYYTFPWMSKLGLVSDEPGYASVFSFTVWRIHWLGLYLSPLVLFWLARRRNWSGLLLWYFGFCAYMIPAVVDFGLWEAEVFRWQYAASWGFSGALGVALGQAWESIAGPAWERRDHALLLRARFFMTSLTLALVILNCYPAWTQVENRTRQVGSLKRAVLFPDPADWLERQPDLDLYPADYRAALWLAPKVGANEGLLTNFREENYFNVFFEAAFAGVCGVQPWGHAFPLRFERLGTWPFRMAAPARAFWATLDPTLLSNDPPRWIYLRGRKELSEPLMRLPGLKLVHQEEGGRYLFTVERPAFEVGPRVDSDLKVTVTEIEGLEGLRVEQYRTLEVTLSNPGDAFRHEGFIYYEMLDSEGKVVDKRERILQPAQLDLAAGEQQKFVLHFVTPHQEGNYRLRLVLGDQQASRALPAETPFKVNHRAILYELKAELLPGDSPPGMTVVRRVALTHLGKQTLDDDVMVALKARTPGSGRDLAAMRDFGRVQLRMNPGETQVLELPVEIPADAAGPLEFDLVLAPRDGVAVFSL